MAYDRDLADGIREIAARTPSVTEKAMFGGLAFLVAGNVGVAASGQGGLMVRVDPDESDELAGQPGVRLFEMGGRSMRGWLSVDPERLSAPGELAAWVERGLEFARSLPAKA